MKENQDDNKEVSQEVSRPVIVNEFDDKGNVNIMGDVQHKNINTNNRGIGMKLVEIRRIS